jgi:hypothetical protein
MIKAGDWMTTISGRQVWPLCATQAMINIYDIAHALSYICRFNGHISFFYSVAEHSCRVSDICKPQYALYGLLHDATEAYLGDVIRPLKPYFTNYNEIEDRLAKTIARKYSFSMRKAAHENVKWADNTLLFTEARDLVSTGGLNWRDNQLYIPLPKKIRPWSPNKAKQEFLRRFKELT